MLENSFSGARSLDGLRTTAHAWSFSGKGRKIIAMIPIYTSDTGMIRRSLFPRKRAPKVICTRWAAFTLSLQAIERCSTPLFRWVFRIVIWLATGHWRLTTW